MISKRVTQSDSKHMVISISWVPYCTTSGEVGSRFFLRLYGHPLVTYFSNLCWTHVRKKGARADSSSAAECHPFPTNFLNGQSGAARLPKS